MILDFTKKRKLRVKVIASIFFFILFTLSINCSFAYQLPAECYDNGKLKNPCQGLGIISLNDGTYKFFGNYITGTSNDLSPPFLYHSKSADLQQIVFIDNICHNLFPVDFYYSNNKFPVETVFFNKSTNELSEIYTNITSNNNTYLCASSPPLIAEYNDYARNNRKGLIIQPIFKNQPKVWILIPVQVSTNDLLDSFPSNTRFLNNGDLYLVLTVKPDPNDPTTPIPDKTETIHIDYSVFNQKVDHPTCYIIPTGKKMRLCTPDEASIRSPALTQFLAQ